jgi:hypothetical protein
MQTLLLSTLEPVPVSRKFKETQAAGYGKGSTPGKKKA